MKSVEAQVLLLIPPVKIEFFIDTQLPLVEIPSVFKRGEASLSYWESSEEKPLSNSKILAVNKDIPL